MRKKTLCILAVISIFAAFDCRSQGVYTDYDDYYGRSRRGSSNFWNGEPARRSGWSNIWVNGGYQALFHDGHLYHAATVHAEYVYSFYGSRTGLTVGPDYIEFSPFGLILFAPAVFLKTINNASLADNPFLTVFMIMAISASQFHIPVADHFEINLGMDGLKFVRMNNINNTFYCTGSLNAGVTGWFGDHLFVQAYYEFNHTHNPAIKIFNWMFQETIIDKQPTWLNGHSFGIRLGWQFGE